MEYVTSEVFFGPDGDEPARIASGRMTSIFSQHLMKKRIALSIRAAMVRRRNHKEIFLYRVIGLLRSIFLRCRWSLSDPRFVSFNWFGRPDGDSLNYMLHLKSKNDSKES